MRSVTIDGIDFPLTSSFRQNRRLLREKGIPLLSESKRHLCFAATVYGIKAEVTVWKTFLTFGASACIKVRFTEDRLGESLEAVDQLLGKTYGLPEWISLFGSRIYDAHTCYLLHGVIEEYKGESHVLEVDFGKKPYVAVPYEKLSKYERLFGELAVRWSLTEEAKPHVGLGCQTVVCFLKSKEYSYGFWCQLREKRVQCTSLTVTTLDTKTTSVKPFYTLKAKYKTMEQLCLRIESFFAYMEEYDTSLIQK